jgi:hypothetical protein
MLVSAFFAGLSHLLLPFAFTFSSQPSALGLASFKVNAVSACLQTGQQQSRINN